MYHTVWADDYSGTPENPQFVARESVPGEHELAEHIFRSIGPSGPNKEYLFELHHALEELCPGSKDNHIRNLFRIISIMEAEERLSMLDESEGEDEEMGDAQPHPHDHQSGQEETEPNMSS